MVPNGFTPNGDGRNDCFGVKSWGSATIEEFSVFNRWGERVFTTNNATACWDGRFRGQQMPGGTNVYIIKAKTFCGSIKRKGTLVLVSRKYKTINISPKKEETVSILMRSLLLRSNYLMNVIP